MKKYTSLSVDDIREIRREENKKLKSMTVKEIVKYHNELARPLKEAIEKRKKVKERKEN